MKYFILVPDGSADNPTAFEGNITPLAAAHMPQIGELAARGEVGLVRTIPDGVAPGSDAANLAVMGYDPIRDLTGRAPLEVASMGIEMAENDVAFRVNFVTLSAPGEGASAIDNSGYDSLVITDHAAGDISNEEAAELLACIDAALGSGRADNDGRVRFWPGVSYRHALIVKDGARAASGIGDVSAEMSGYTLTAPHDILGKQIAAYLPAGPGSEFLRDAMRQSYDLLKDHPVNVARRARGLNTADSIWIWGQGKRPSLASFHSKFGIKGSVISAVDLIKGIGVCAGLSPVDVPGATGTIHTNYAGKAQAAITAFRNGADFVYLHVEAPDECSHQGDAEGKHRALELIDEGIARPVIEYLAACGDDYRVLVVPDHRTPLSLRTHSSDPVPFVIYDSTIERYNNENEFTELSGEKGRRFDSGGMLAEYFFGR